jgi:hypothetical protein
MSDTRPVRGARVLRAPIVAIVAAACIAALLDLGVSVGLIMVTDDASREQIFSMSHHPMDASTFRTLGGAFCRGEDLGDLARMAALRGARWGLVIGLSLSLAASSGRLRMRLGGGS